MVFRLFLQTLVHLRLTQIFYQVKYRLIKPSYVPIEAPTIDGLKTKTAPIVKYNCLERDKFSFLGLEHRFAGWNFTENGMLWAYNQNYFDWINQEGFSKEDGCKWIDMFIDNLSNNKVGLDPYPTALRCINWVKFFCRYPDAATKFRLDSLYSQLRLLDKKLEYHLLGNHLLEDGYSLYIGAAYFSDILLLNKAEEILKSQLKEQVLPDGAHYEQSPMYHCILLDRLLDCINIRETIFLVGYAQKMLGHLESIIWADGTIPMLNDSANCIAPPPKQIFDYAKRLGVEWESIPMKECGYRKLQYKNIEAIVDVGNITATYQPGHTHADTFNYELHLERKPFVVDAGISTYNKTERRQLERSTVAHNTVSVGSNNSSEVWGGFRVGRRCHTEIAVDSEKTVEAIHDGFEKDCRRRFEIKEDGFTVDDWYEGEAVSYIHLSENADEKRVKVEGALCVETKPWKYSTEYNRFIDGKVVEIRFHGHCQYTIQ